VTAFVPVQIRLVTPISEFEPGQQSFRQSAGKILRMGWFNRGSNPHVGLQALQRCSGLLNRRARGSTVATHHFADVAQQRQVLAHAPALPREAH
jgi:hypothetical protein